ncbi:uncharacterized protein LOC106180245 [Lingula anatina]|uniref:Uncharacterized protein LOC106180245 n=1 Tax=Lingula anatina TaxID=7574 RepID=A0A1S3KAI9_LINAN|nr:uncharacterized protein LOC106180245 [Lingula anatina]|eukprot:XP_013419635.1 uncharacterized protein LOC106180245 [Lingula anatina]
MKINVALAVFAVFLTACYADDEPVGETVVEFDDELDGEPVVTEASVVVTEAPMAPCRGRQVLACMNPLIQWAQEKGISLFTSGRDMGREELPTTRRDYVEASCGLFGEMRECFSDLKERCLPQRPGFLYGKLLDGLEATFGVICGPKMGVYLNHLVCLKEVTKTNVEALRVCKRQAAGLGVKIAMSLFGLVSRETICEGVDSYADCVANVYEECGEDVSDVMNEISSTAMKRLLRLEC